MKSKKYSKAWVAFVFKKSVNLLECHFEDSIWKEMWKLIQKFYDC